MEPLTGEVFRMPHETELWDTHVLFYWHRIFSSPSCGSFLTFRRSGSVPAVRKEKRMYFDAKEFGKRLHDVRTVALRRRSWRFAWDWQASSMSAVWRTESAAAPLIYWSNCPASFMSARIIFWWAASQVKRKSKMIFWALFRSCLRLRRKSNRALRLEMTK